MVLSLLWASQERNTFLPSMPVMFASSLTTEPRVIGLGEGSGGEWLVAWSLRKVGDVYLHSGEEVIAPGLGAERGFFCNSSYFLFCYGKTHTVYN